MNRRRRAGEDRCFAALLPCALLLLRGQFLWAAARRAAAIFSGDCRFLPAMAWRSTASRKERSLLFSHMLARKENRLVGAAPRGQPDPIGSCLAAAAALRCSFVLLLLTTAAWWVRCWCQRCCCALRCLLVVAFAFCRVALARSSNQLQRQHNGM